MYCKVRLSSIQSSDILRGGRILLVGTGGVGGYSTALCSRKLNLLNRPQEFRTGTGISGIF
jgi:hypothetical protein